jgi:hypothetical protein
MARDEWVIGALLIAFATLVTAHLTIVAGLAQRPPRRRAIVALFLVPMAPYWGVRERMFARSAAWIASAAAYAVGRWLAAR